MARTATFTTALGTKVWEITAKSVKDFSGFLRAMSWKPKRTMQ